MKRLSAIALTVVALATAAVGQLTRDQLPPGAEISDEKLELTNWMMFYYKNPSPDVFPRWLSRASAEGMLKEERRQFPFLGFAATVFADNAGKVPTWMTTVDALPERERKTVLIALWLSNTKEAQQVLAEKSRQALLIGDNYFRLQTKKAPPSLVEIDKYWGYLDIQWGQFSASGSETPITHIVSVLEYAKYMGARQKYPKPKREGEKEAVRREILYQTTLWSLRSNCQMHPRILEICEKIYKEGKLSRLAQLALKAVLSKVKPDKYKIEGTSNKPDAGDGK